MWWHHVEGFSDFNILVNYWWRRTPAWLGQPQAALNHAILAIRDLPPEDKAIWREQFDHYVFENDEQVTDHIPEKARSILARLTRSEEHTSELQSLMRISYAVFCLKKKKQTQHRRQKHN